MSIRLTGLRFYTSPAQQNGKDWRRGGAKLAEPTGQVENDTAPKVVAENEVAVKEP